MSLYMRIPMTDGQARQQRFRVVQEGRSLRVSDRPIIMDVEHGTWTSRVQIDMTVVDHYTHNVPANEFCRIGPVLFVNRPPMDGGPLLVTIVCTLEDGETEIVSVIIPQIEETWKLPEKN